ncbi:hypothetical protein [Sulfitobacter guttiformis]|uniref:Phytanoyl-CoA dioxygenase PhyH n=1 Tax=Sulfitobacter guttiformis TaxID=74349 RepID=A0A420DJH7_9RHOB|nr:hypothetical protein [Sulfitobacter guttiformis]KIN71830.1 hypothetical protein Z949_994 [Sulfitobacter guttiformis KCTC 32187]RKE94355.1 hypothetical protein C8N30_3480 [Sulfitobacter guttiformis]
MINRTDGFTVFDPDPDTARWAQAAVVEARKVATDPAMHGPENLRHGKTWFVGVDLLPNDAAGLIGGVALRGPWHEHVPDLPLHQAQVSIIYPGYPQQDPDESDANHRYRRQRSAAHVDGLLPVGPARRRFAREFHAYILSIPLNNVAGSPTTVWRGSHRIMQAALRKAIGSHDPAQVDITEVYKDARREVFATCEEIPLILGTGQSALLHPFVLHGTQEWRNCADPQGEGRMIAFFRPQYTGGAAQWLSTP